MLLFIVLRSSDHWSPPDFNTSHVTVYHGNVQQNLAQQRNFNTSHVTVYRRKIEFIPIGFKHFNTSHVTVYQEMAESGNKLYLFQYISCYCLSTWSQ